jgi:hypothetical protein
MMLALVLLLPPMPPEPCHDGTGENDRGADRAHQRRNVGRRLGTPAAQNLNTAVGLNAFEFNTTGGANTAIGARALAANQGSYNTAIGSESVLFNSTGICNTATGAGALYVNTTGSDNTATGKSALETKYYLPRGSPENGCGSHTGH